MGSTLLTLKTPLIFFTALTLLAENFFLILYKIGAFFRSAVLVKVHFGSKSYNSRSLFIDATLNGNAKNPIKIGKVFMNNMAA